MEFTPQYLIIIVRTIILAAITTLLCLMLAVPVAYFIATQPGHRKAVLLFLVTLPFWMSMILRVYAWMIILGKDGSLPQFIAFIGGPEDVSLMFNDGATLAAMVYTLIPLMVLPVLPPSKSWTAP